MIDELALLKDIVIELTNAGGYALFAYISFQLVKLIAVWWPIYWLVNKIIHKVSDFLSSPITREEAKKIQQESEEISSKIKRSESDHYAEISKKNAEVERVKHMYKILKGEEDGGS